jgi:hypothetical protein
VKVCEIPDAEATDAAGPRAKARATAAEPTPRPMKLRRLNVLVVSDLMP